MTLFISNIFQNATAVKKQLKGSCKTRLKQRRVFFFELRESNKTEHNKLRTDV